MYFAFGSNMSRSRLQARIGPVVSLGCARLSDFAHAFSHHGRDGSAKGNIVCAPGSQVHGVLYQLGEDQIARLHPYEGGYDVISVQVVVVACGKQYEAYTYMDSRPPCDLLPSEEYLEHYRQGMREHALPEDYILAILKQAGR